MFKKSYTNKYNNFMFRKKTQMIYMWKTAYCKN